MPPEGVNVSLDEMYRLLLQVDHKVTTLTTSAAATQVSLSDHESRIRAIEAAAGNEQRVTAMEDDIKAIRGDLESMKRKVYAIPSLSAAVAGAALIITLIRWL